MHAAMLVLRQVPLIQIMEHLLLRDTVRRLIHATYHLVLRGRCRHMQLIEVALLLALVQQVRGWMGGVLVARRVAQFRRVCNTATILLRAVLR